MSEQLYTSSRLKVLRDCLRKHYFRYVLNIHTPSTAVMDFGAVGHRALEAWYRAWKAGDLEHRLEHAIAAITAAALPEDDKTRLRVLVAAYDARWGAEPWEVLEIEVEFRYELGGYLVGGKIDAIIRNITDDRVYVVEHKTSGQDASAGSAYWDRLAIDTQVSIYVDGATVLGHEIAGCVYDVLQRPRHERKLATPKEKREYTLGKGCKLCGGSLQGTQGSGASVATTDGKCAACKGTGWRHDKDGKPEAPKLYAKQREADETYDEFSERIIDEISADVDAFLIRGIVVRLEDEIPRMRTELLDTIKLERLTAVVDLHPPNHDACSKFGAMCSFYDVCKGTASVDDETRFPRGVTHPELATTA